MTGQQESRGIKGEMADDARMQRQPRLSRLTESIIEQITCRGNRNPEKEKTRKIQSGASWPPGYKEKMN
jgi:hypothetical protein